MCDGLAIVAPPIVIATSLDAASEYRAEWPFAGVVERRPREAGNHDFAGRVSREGGLDFVAVANRIVTFDNDGTLWAEQPIYVQFAFILNPVKALTAVCS